MKINEKDRYKMKINKKGGMSVSIALLVLATLVLSSFSLLTFYLREKNLQAIIYSSSLEDIYSKEEIINFYLKDIFDSSVKDFKIEEGEGKLAENLKQVLESYKQEGSFFVPELAQIEKQAYENPNIFIIENNRVKAEFQIMIEDKIVVKEKGENKELFSADYTYKKTFEKVI